MPENEFEFYTPEEETQWGKDKEALDIWAGSALLHFFRLAEEGYISSQEFASKEAEIHNVLDNAKESRVPVNANFPYYNEALKVTPELTYKLQRRERERRLEELTTAAISGERPDVSGLSPREKQELQDAVTKAKAEKGKVAAEVRTKQEKEEFKRKQEIKKEERLRPPYRSFGEPELVERLAGMIGQAQALGIKTGGYEQFLQKYAAGTLGGEVDSEQAMGNEIRALQAQTHTRRAIEQKRESALLASEYPAWFRRFQQALGQGAARFDLTGPGIPVRDITREEDIFSMWEDPAFKEARIQRETGLLEQFPTLFSAFRSQPIGEREKGFQPWVQSMPETRAFFQTRMAELTRPQRKPTPRWLPARGI